MMKSKEIADELLRLETEYRHVYDGGYALVRAIREWARRLDTPSRQILWDLLFESVAKQESGLWGVALDTLVEENPENIAQRLENLLVRGEMSDEGRHYVVFALLRLGYLPAAAKCFDYIKEALLRDGPTNILSVLAASCRVDSEECIKLSACYFGRVLRSEKAADEYRGSISAFVRHFLDVDERLLGELVRRTKLVNADAGMRLARLMVEYLAKPFFAREVGLARATALEGQIHAAELA
jgi:hypothetical protein